MNGPCSNVDVRDESAACHDAVDQRRIEWKGEGALGWKRLMKLKKCPVHSTDDGSAADGEDTDGWFP